MGVGVLVFVAEGECVEDCELGVKRCMGLCELCVHRCGWLYEDVVWRVSVSGMK